ncbi:MAG: type I 3-dehydroquinate dehydratase [Rhodocyclaceae bacterium]
MGVTSRTIHHEMKSLTLHKVEIGQNHPPRICAPLIGTTAEAIDTELHAIGRAPVDIIEWRIDFFTALDSIEATLEQAKRIREQSSERPIILTRRSFREGGQPIELDDEAVLEIYRHIASADLADAFDWELSAPGNTFSEALELCRTHAKALIASFHDFGGTPDKSFLLAKFHEAAGRGANIAKIAAMPQTPRDVLTLLDATLEASATLDIPLVSMSMAALGSASRVIGWQFGSAITFGSVGASSAPGQLPVHELRNAIDMLRRATN